MAIPNMPVRHPWLADSVFPISHGNAAATNSVAHAGPTRGRQLTKTDVKTVPSAYCSSGTVKRAGDATTIIASGIDGIRKIDATGQAFDLVSFLPYPGLEAVSRRATPEALAATLAETDAAVRDKSDQGLLALSGRMAELGFGPEQRANGVFNLIDKDGFHYAAFDGLKIIKSTDDNDPRTPLRVARVKDLSTELSAETLRRGTTIRGVSMTYDGDLAAAVHGALFLLDRDLNLKGTLALPGETVHSGICADEAGLYVVTSLRMLKIVWTGSRLSCDEADGGWHSPYHTVSDEPASLGALTTSGSSGATPALMGFGDDPDKLVIIVDRDPQGTRLVAFWRDRIPTEFTQKPGTTSRRIADQVRIEIGKMTVEPCLNVFGDGALVLNRSYPEPAPDIWGNAMTAGVTRPVPRGAQKLTWNRRSGSFEKRWINRDVDNTDAVIPIVSAATGLVYFASKRDGRYEYVALDWNTGTPMARWPFPDDSRRWNGWGAGTVVLENGDLFLGGLFALKRVKVGDGTAPR